MGGGVYKTTKGSEAGRSKFIKVHKAEIKGAELPEEGEQEEDQSSMHRKDGVDTEAALCGLGNSLENRYRTGENAWKPYLTRGWYPEYNKEIWKRRKKKKKKLSSQK